jgi:hypothetical protein
LTSRLSVECSSQAARQENSDSELPAHAVSGALLTVYKRKHWYSAFENGSRRPRRLLRELVGGYMIFEIG